MSKENVKLFYQALAGDKALQEKFQVLNKTLPGNVSDQAQADLIYQKELLPLAKQAGFEFTLAELKEYASDAKKPVMRELSEEELAAVAGGNCICIFGGGGNLSGVTCACVIGGGGGTKKSGHWCVCPVYGEGYMDWSDAPSG
jgi:predicted ribosomally synthesized peptide with nif11-like leader